MKHAASLILATFLSIGVGATQFHVAVNGTATNDGTVDSPLTFAAAIERASAMLKRTGLPEDGLTISVGAGTYRFREPFVLGPEFAGTPERPIRIQAVDGAEVWFDGSPLIDPRDFAPVIDPRERSRLPVSASDRIRVATIADPALIKMLTSKVVLNLTYDGRVYLPAKFPNKGYATLKGKTVVPEVCPPGIPVGKQNYGIRAGHPPHREPGKPQGWKGSLQEPRGAQVGIAARAGEMAGTWEQWERELKRTNTRNQLTGFIEANWLLSSQPLHAANAEKQCVHLSRALSYGWAWRNNDKPFRLFGLLCELDAPGEWHFDVLTNRLYLYPPSKITESTSISLPVAMGFMTLQGTRHVMVVGLSVRNVGGGSVYRLVDGRHNLVASCMVMNSAATGFEIAGTDNAVKGCDLLDLNHHVALAGGVRSPTEITPGRNTVENCHIYQKQFRHQKVNISLSGVANTFRNNLVHNSIGQAMTINGNDHLIELNEFFNVGYDEGDGGAIYAGGDLTGYGTTYRHNFLHHLMHCPGKVERSGIHLDDLQAGATCIGNVFYKSAAKGIHCNGGAGNTALGNVFLEGMRGFYSTGAGGERNYRRELAIARDPNHMYRNTKENYIGRAERIVGTEGWTKSPWKEKFPLFHQVMSDTGRYGRQWPIRCRVEGNLYYGNKINHTLFSRVHPEAMKKNVVRGDRAIEPDVFVDYARLDLRFRKGNGSMPDIPFERIGLRLDEYRREMPEKEHYRMRVKAFFRGIGSMPGTRNQIDTAGVVEDGPILTRSHGRRPGKPAEIAAMRTALDGTDPYEPDAVYLSEVQPLSATVHHGLKANTNYAGNGPCVLAGITYPRSIMMHPAKPANRGEAVYDLTGIRPDSRRFMAVVGIDAAMGSRGDCRFIVEVETAGKRKALFRSDVLRGNGGTKAIDIPLGQADRLILRTDGGSTIDADHAVWGGARLVPETR